MVTEDRSGDCKPRESDRPADLIETCSPLVVAELGAKTQLLGKAVVDDAALREESVKVTLKTRERESVNDEETTAIRGIK